jgi:hypothetical protein
VNHPQLEQNLLSFSSTVSSYHLTHTHINYSSQYCYSTTNEEVSPANVNVNSFDLTTNVPRQISVFHIYVTTKSKSTRYTIVVEIIDL